MLGFVGCMPRWVCRCDTMSLLKMRSPIAVLLPLVVAVVPGFSQTATDEDYRIFTDSPRLLLTNQRLRLLQRERERNPVGQKGRGWK